MAKLIPYLCKILSFFEKSDNNKKTQLGTNKCLLDSVYQAPLNMFITSSLWYFLTAKHTIEKTMLSMCNLCRLITANKINFSFQPSKYSFHYFGRITISNLVFCDKFKVFFEFLMKISILWHCSELLLNIESAIC